VCIVQQQVDVLEWFHRRISAILALVSNKPWYVHGAAPHPAQAVTSRSDARVRGGFCVACCDVLARTPR
jgi:hypothetical protein